MKESSGKNGMKRREQGTGKVPTDSAPPGMCPRPGPDHP